MNTLFFILVVSAIATEIPSIECTLPEITITAHDYYDLGYQYGVATRKMVQERWKEDKRLQEKFIPWSKTPEGMKELQRVIDIHENEFPEYMAEMKGLAHGADVEFTEVFMRTMSEEFSNIIGNMVGRTNPDQCSDILLKEKDQLAIIHNEDGVEIDQNRTFILHAKNAFGGKLRGEFTAYVYAGQLPTGAFGHNKVIAYTMNYLETHKANVNGWGRNFIARRLLEAKSFEEAMSILVHPNYFVAHNYQIISLEDRRAYTIEVAPFGVYAIYTPMEERSRFHANMFNLAIVDDVYDESSIRREKRAKELMPARTIRESLEIMGDTADKDYPIYQTGCEARLYTIHTAVYNWEERQLIIYVGNPMFEKVLYKYNL